MAFREARLWGAIGLFSLLVACGGGGSSGSDGTNTGGSDTANSIVPAAPPLGEILTADASSLRPLISGATWTYAGIHTLDGNSTRYTNAVTQTAQGGTFTETSSNALNEGTDSVTLSLSNGSIINSSVGALLSGLTQQITYPELRSPVRQNDQITLMDQQVTDIGEDLDGDGKNDSGEVGVYRIVVGAEDVSMPNGIVEHAVRVDTVFLVRVTLSSTGAVSETLQAGLQSSWYAPGIGIVKQEFTIPVTDSSDEVFEEVLTSFDGITRGFGATPATTALIPSNAAMAAGQTLQSVNAAVAFSDHAILVGSFTNAQATTYTAISSVDIHGQVSQTNFYTGVPTSGFYALGNQLVAVQPSDSSGNGCQLNVFLFDAHGVRAAGDFPRVVDIPPAPGQTLCHRISQLQIASDGSQLWLAMVRSSISTSGWVTDMFIRPFDASGAPLANETTLQSVNTLATTGFDLRSLSAAGGTARVAYFPDAGTTLRLTSITDAGIQKQANLALNSSSVTGLTLLAKADATGLFWQGLTNAGTGQAPTLGVLLDTDLNPVIANGNNSLDAQTLPRCSGCATFLNGADASWVMESDHLSISSASSVTLSTLASTSGALTSQTVTPMLLSLSDIGDAGMNIMSLRLVPFANRVLVLAEANQQLFTKLAWLP